MIKVIGAGFGRTGTTSLKLALERLGFGPCYHFTEMMRARHTADWLDIAKGGTPEWDRLLSQFSSTTDWPAAAYYKELAEHFPDARVILTVRDPDAWHRSICATLLALSDSITGWTARWLPGVGTISELMDTLVWHGTFNGRAHDRSQALKILDTHCEAVRRSIAPERLLEFDVRSGWPPLCEFLDVPIPVNEPFPRANDTARMRRVINAIKVARVVFPATIAIVIAVAVAYLIYRLSY